MITKMIDEVIRLLGTFTKVVHIDALDSSLEPRNNPEAKDNHGNTVPYPYL